MSTASKTPESPSLPQSGNGSNSVDESERLDSIGQHDQAIVVLAEASKRGDVAATTRLGKRLLVGDGLPVDAGRGTELIFRAANAGDAEAATQLSVLAAIGMHTEQSWETALAALVFAAERGWARAQGQLAVLAEDRALADRLSAGSADKSLWWDLARSIDLKRWHGPTAGANLNEEPLVRHFPTFAPKPVCDWMIDRARGRLVRARVYDAGARKETISQTRSNTWAVFNLTHADLVSVLLQVHMSANLGVPLRHFEPSVVLHYAVGEEITEHYDFVDPNVPNYEREIAENGQRIVTFLVYLNDDYVGGETEMPELGIDHKGARGEGLFFVNAFENGDADTRTVHAGRPTSSGEKWIVSQFIRNRPTF